ncbi:TATA box-binding protein-associated factor RNA polymerase I subunit B [Actinidia eriantha]|uniref:TATA box-binding protein-associated factor RNA polymerase I subunit B n=1 Tax=Actinidia eriantha TaxID=165200 RepID=UPI0025855254|nr:TATA box-binding protein-associated factor RNA polymerase I subunit B [Actinidia eriantha]XP_057484744.1 TATA box-binding protein-associated factor RNA polymerase I subunit B [Actinidia eriantha]
MADKLELTCHACGHVGFADGSDGFFYCLRCGSQAEDIIDTAVADDELLADPASHRRHRSAAVSVKVEPLSQSQPQSQFWDSLRALDDDVSARVKQEDGVGPTGPGDFGSAPSSLSYDDYYSEIRMRYVMGIQIMIQMQCKALVEEFQVSPLICGLAGSIWLRFVALSGVFGDGWADETIYESESQKQGQPDDFKPRAKYSAEPHNIHGQRAVMIWYRSLSKKIPLSHSLAISFLVCHLAREAVLPTDILKWSLEGKLPYFAAFVEIEKQIGPPSNTCPLSSSFMFKPSEAIPLRKLESQAASIAQAIGLELPPVNFYAIASRYLTKFSLPVGKILPCVCQIYEWSLPPELWLSANEYRLPTRVCVMSMVIVAIRILYNINGFGFWEKSLSSFAGSSSRNGQEEPTRSADVRDDAKQGYPSPGLVSASTDCSKNSSQEKSELEAMEILRILEARYKELEEKYEYSKDLPTYLQYCKDVVFAGLEPPFDDLEEEKIINELWDFYQERKDSGRFDDPELGCNHGSHQKRSRDDVVGSEKENKKIRDDMSSSSRCTNVETSQSDDCSHQSMNVDGCSPSDSDSPPVRQDSSETDKERVIRRMKTNMEENRFCYIPPRVKVKRLDYLHYVRKKGEGAYTYAAHADYYILLRSCARVARVDIRVMHAGVLSFERRLGWLEKRIDHCLNLRPPSDSCEFCREEAPKDSPDDSIDVSKLNL